MNSFVAKNFILIYAYYNLPACDKMDITPRKRAQIVVALRQHSNMIKRKIVEKQNMSKSNVGRILKIMDTNRDVTKTKKRGQRGRKRKTTSRDHKMILQNSFKDLRKTSKDLQRDLATTGVYVDSLTLRKRLLEVGRKARSPCKKQFLTVAMKKKCLKWGKKYKKGGEDGWRKVVFRMRAILKCVDAYLNM